MLHKVGGARHSLVPKLTHGLFRFQTILPSLVPRLSLRAKKERGRARAW